MDKLKTVRRQLEQELEERLSRVKRIDDRLSQPGLADWEEQATQRENDEVMESLGKQTQMEIEQIKQAIQRIDHGTYGVCSRCQRPIAEGRLEALPYATTCVDCTS